jgi:hypothetical protein
LESLYEKYSKKNQLAEALMELLTIEREAVYRRLRKEVEFPFHEIVKIASAWNISINEIIGVSSGNIPFFMRPLNYHNLSEVDLNILSVATEFLQKLGPSLESEYMEICNKLPRSVVTNFVALNQFYLFKWAYQYGNQDPILPYSKAVFSEKRPQVVSDYYSATKNLSTISYILDPMLFDFFVCDVRYFYFIKLITDEEKELIKKDIHALLNYMAEIAYKGYFLEEKQKINIYISRINVDTNYSYIYTKSFKICLIHVLSKCEIYTTDDDLVANFIKWIQLKKRTSIQISEVDEMARIEYFTKQHQLVDTL